MASVVISVTDAPSPSDTSTDMGSKAAVHIPSSPRVSVYSLPFAAARVPPLSKALPPTAQPPASVLDTVTDSSLVPRVTMISMGTNAADHMPSSPRVSVYWLLAPVARLGPPSTVPPEAKSAPSRV